MTEQYLQLGRAMETNPNLRVTLPNIASDELVDSIYGDDDE